MPYDLSGGPSAEFGNDGSKMGHRDYTEWRKAGGSHDEFMQYMYDNPHMQGKGTHLVAELEHHGQNRDFREGDINPNNTEYGWLGWDNTDSDVGYDLLPDKKKPEKPEPKIMRKPIGETINSKGVQEALERIQTYKSTYQDFAPGEHPFYNYDETHKYYKDPKESGEQKHGAAAAQANTATSTNSGRSDFNFYNKESDDNENASNSFLSNSILDLQGRNN